MLGLAKFVMKGPYQALIAAVLLSALTVWFAPIGLLVGAIIGLVTLRVGVLDGFKVLVWSILANVGLTVALTGSYLPAWVSVVEFMLPIWLLAVVLRNTNSLATTLQLAMILVGLGVIGFHLMVSNPAEWWLALFNQQIKPLLDASQVEYNVENIQKVAEMVTMLLASFVLILWFSILMTARWWQGSLYHPGQFQKDFYQFALPKNVAYVAIVLAVLGAIFGNQQGLIFDISGIVISGLMFQGLAIAHQTVAVKKLHNAWLVSLYVALFIFPQVMLILAVIGLLDIWSDFRSKWVQD
ncbi:MAG: hypothetical protein JXK16_00430 [Thiotrichales bacterium]|nr:hypothetical protein [Thiotrichales bacterium]